MFTKPQRRSRGLREWQQLDNQLYGQLVLAFHRQKPFVAFSRVSTIFSSSEVYGEVFRRRKDFKTEIDLLRLHDAFLTWRDDLLEQGGSDIQESIVTQGRFSLISSCALLLKVRRQLVDVSKRNEKGEWRRELTRNDLSGPLFETESKVDLADETLASLSGLFSLLVEVHGSVIEPETVGKLYKSEDFHNATLTPRLVDRFLDRFLGRALSDTLNAFK